MRPGNPKSIHDWDDLARPGVSVLYPDPKTSGGARWNINAIYGAGLLGAGGDARSARDLLARVQANVVNMDASGRQSMATFERGTGDAVVTYENELLLQRKRTGLDVPYVIPPATLLIEGPAALVDAVVEQHGNRAVAEAFLAFLRSAEAQAILADYGFRPLDPGSRMSPASPRCPPPLHHGRPRGLEDHQQGGLRPGGRLGLALHRAGAGTLTMSTTHEHGPIFGSTVADRGARSAGRRSRTWA